MSEKVTDMCRVAAALEGTVKEDFCQWFIDQQVGICLFIFHLHCTRVEFSLVVEL